MVEGAKWPFTLPMAKTKPMVLVFGFSFPFSAGFQGQVVLVSGKVVLVFGFSFWFQFLALEEGFGYFCLLWHIPMQLNLLIATAQKKKSWESHVMTRAELKVTDLRWRSPICNFLQKSSVFCGKSADFCGFLRPPHAWISKRRGESAKICALLRKSAFWALSLSVTLVLSPLSAPLMTLLRIRFRTPTPSPRIPY